MIILTVILTIFFVLLALMCLGRMSYHTKALDAAGLELNPIGVKWTLSTIGLTILGFALVFAAYTVPLRTSYDWGGVQGSFAASIAGSATFVLWLVYAVRMVIHFVRWLFLPFHRTSVAKQR